MRKPTANESAFLFFVANHEALPDATLAYYQTYGYSSDAPSMRRIQQ
jgi:hypothetical protein